MVGTIVRLQLKLFARQLKSNRAALILNVILAITVFGSILALLNGLIALRGADPLLRGGLTVAGFAVLTIGWPFATVFMTGSNEMLDPGRFALYPVRAKELLPGFFVAGLTGLGGIATVLLSLGYLVAWSDNIATLIAAVFGAVLGIAICLLGSRALTSGLSALMQRRKAKDFTGIFLFLVIMGVSFGIQFLSQWMAQFGDPAQIMATLERFAYFLAFTPMGWPWAIPWSVADGAWLAAGLQLLGSVVLAAGLFWIWGRQLSKGLISPLDTGGSGAKLKATNFFDRFLPYSPAGAIARRGVRYWRRDPRRMVGSFAMLLIPVMFVFMFFMIPVDEIGGDGTRRMMIAYTSVALSWMVATMVAAELCYDGSALSTQVLTGATGAEDRLGRALGFLVIFAPIQLVLIIGTMLYSQTWSLLPGILAIVIVLMVGGAGLGNLIGSVWQYQQPPPEANMFGKGSTGGAAGFASAMIGMFGPLLVASPVIVLAVMGYSNPLFNWVALAVSLGLSALLMWLGIKVAGDRLDRMWPEVIDRITWKG